MLDVVLLLASHNVMHGLRMEKLTPIYRTLAATLDLGVLCLQENRAADGLSHADMARSALGDHFAMVCRGASERLAVIYDQRKVSVRYEDVVALPKLSVLPTLAPLYMASRVPEQKYALVVTVTPTVGEPFTLVNFHLDAAGTNAHRQRQLESLTERLAERRLHARLVACGDTNAFTLRASGHKAAYDRVLSPLTALGATDPETRPTHFFARANEPRWAQRLLVALGRFRFDMPRRYDVICTNVPTPSRGHVTTPDSDHDLLWARLALT